MAVIEHQMSFLGATDNKSSNWRDPLGPFEETFEAESFSQCRRLVVFKMPINLKLNAHLFSRYVLGWVIITLISLFSSPWPLSTLLKRTIWRTGSILPNWMKGTLCYFVTRRTSFIFKHWITISGVAVHLTFLPVPRACSVCARIWSLYLYS